LPLQLHDAHDIAREGEDVGIAREDAAAFQPCRRNREGIGERGPVLCLDAACLERQGLSNRNEIDGSRAEETQRFAGRIDPKRAESSEGRPRPS
jgi:hypothetical protein